MAVINQRILVSACQRMPSIVGQALLGVAVNWGEVNETSFGRGLDDQYTLELFYRWQLTKKFAFTADYQFLKDPALNPDEDSIHVWSFRGRFAL